MNKTTPKINTAIKSSMNSFRAISNVPFLISLLYALRLNTFCESMRKGDLEFDKIFAIVLAVIALAVVVFMLMKWTTQGAELFSSMFG